MPDRNRKTALGRLLALAPLLIASAASAAPIGPINDAFGGRTISALSYNVQCDGVTDDTTNLRAAVTAAEAAKAVLTLPAGTCLISGLTGGSYFSLVGADRFRTTLMGTSASSPVIAVSGSPYSVADLTIDRGVTATAGAGLSVANNNYGRIARVTSQNQYTGFALGATSDSACDACWAQDNFADGFDFYDVSGSGQSFMQWQVYHLLSQGNDGWGVSISATGTHDDTGPFLVQPNTYANTLGGYIVTGGGAGEVNDLYMIEPVASSDNGQGLYFARPGRNVQIISPFVELVGQSQSGRRFGKGLPSPTAASNAGHCILFDTGGDANSDVSITGGVLSACSHAGVYVGSSSLLKSLQITGLRAKDNGVGGSNGFGVYIHGSPALRTAITGLVATNQDSSKQQYGVYLDGANAPGATTLAGGDLTGNGVAALNVSPLSLAAVAGVGGLSVSTTVGALPGSAAAGTRGIVTDATACAFNSTPAGGGSTRCPVVYNGSAWVAG